ncbi:MAG: entericidin A/B family lipoprotein [Alphaproteobacteria bacterium]|nr:entericidin A/B family lipoprotein [Alphaproteobacteria bacterium]
MRWLFLIFCFSFMVASCETIKGVGRDIENAGEAIDDAVSN